jgi:hypothetical protein
MRARCPAHLLLSWSLYLAKNTSYEAPQYVFFSNFLSLHLLGPNSLLSTLRLCSSLKVIYCRSHPCWILSNHIPKLFTHSPLNTPFSQFLRSPDSLGPLPSYTFLKIFLSHVLNMSSSFSLVAHVSRPYIATGEESSKHNLIIKTFTFDSCVLAGRSVGSRSRHLCCLLIRVRT